MIEPNDLNKVTIQMYRVGDPIGDTYDVIPHASGVLLEFNETCYLISAAHNFDEEDLKRIGFLSKQSDLIIFQGDLSRFSTDNPINIPADIAVYRLTDDTKQDLLKDGYQMISINDILLNKEYNYNDKFHIFGYPASQSKKNKKRGIIIRKPFYYISRLKRIPKLQYYDALVNLPINWHHRKLRTSNNRRAHSCKPDGLSGCGLWIERNNRLQLVGIMISYNKTHSFLMASIIDLATEIIRSRFNNTVPQTSVCKLKD